ncbi:MAG: glycosyltransferase [Bdellovibrionota bacterium]|nr:glycosyltransferase [Bdellovibrionota bacterium]
MDSTSDISVVIIARNSALTIAACLDSVLAQDLGFAKIIIVDNCSQDETTSILGQYSHLKHIEIIHEKRIGRSVARNRGISLVQTDYTLLLDSDIQLGQDFCLHLKEYLGKYNPDILIGRVVPFTTQENFLDSYRSRFKSFVSNDTFVSLFKRDNIAPVVNTATAVFRTSLFSEVGGFDERLSRSEDRDLSRRLFYAHKVITVNSNLVSFSLPTRKITDYLMRSFDYGLANANYDRLWGDRFEHYSLGSLLDFYKFSQSLHMVLFFLVNNFLYRVGYFVGWLFIKKKLVPSKEKLSKLKVKLNMVKKNILKFRGGIYYLQPMWFYFFIDERIVFVDRFNNKITLDKDQSKTLLDLFDEKKSNRELKCEALINILRKNQVYKRML